MHRNRFAAGLCAPTDFLAGLKGWAARKPKGEEKGGKEKRLNPGERRSMDTCNF